MLTPVYASPRWLVRDHDNTLRLPVSSGRALVVPSSGTFSLRDADGVEVYSGDISVVNQAAQVVVEASLLPATLDLGDGWVETWELEVGGESVLWERAAAIVRSSLHPTVTDTRLEAAAPWLARLGPSRDYSSQRELAWDLLLQQLSGLQRWPWLILSSDALQPVHISLTLEILASDPGLPAQYAAQAAEYGKKAEKAFAALPLRYDSDGDGVQDARPGSQTRSRVGTWTSDREWVW